MLLNIYVCGYYIYRNGYIFIGVGMYFFILKGDKNL